VIKKQLQKANPTDNGDSIEYKFDDLLGSNVKTFISTHDAVIYCQKQLLIKSADFQYVPQNVGAKSTSERENSGEIKYAQTDAKNNVQIISTDDKKDTNADLNIVYEQNGNDDVIVGSSNNETYSE